MKLAEALALVDALERSHGLPGCEILAGSTLGTRITRKSGAGEVMPRELADVLAAFPGATIEVRPVTPVPDEPRLGDWVWSRPLPPRRRKWR